MSLINHVNIANEENRIYCCLRNRVVRLDEKHKAAYCAGCSMYEGNARGTGVECVWDDHRTVSNPHIVRNPETEWHSNQARKIAADLQFAEPLREEGLSVL
jgi:hypothetical protein